MNDSLDFDTLRSANARRIQHFRNGGGKVVHTSSDGSDWTPAQWLQALVGEVGEFANVRKKYERGDITFEQYAVEARKELGDIQSYLDILARRALDRRDGTPDASGGINLGEVTVEKFNEVSRRVNSPVRIVRNIDGNGYGQGYFVADIDTGK